MSINKKLEQRIIAQADEANQVGMTKVAQHLNHIKEHEDVRDDDASYLYSSAELASDVEGRLWEAIVRIADFYNCNFDASALRGDVEKVAQDLIKTIGKHGGVVHGVGAYEPPVPGEKSE